MRTQLKICTEADYLQAHLTVIEAESRDRSPAWRILKQRVACVLKKWIFGGTASSDTETSYIDARGVFLATKTVFDDVLSRAKQNKGMHVTKLYVGNLSYGMTDESLLQLFSEKGYKAVSARIITDRETGRSRGFGFVELGPSDDATRAIGEFNGLNVDGRALMVNEARQESGGGGAHRGGGRGFSGGRGGRGGGGGRRGY